jgi:hypothetical protein
MVRKEKTLYVFHDELFYELINPQSSNRKKKLSTNIEINNDFSTHEIMLLVILLDHYIKCGGLGTSLSLSYIHSKYRNKRVGKNKVMSNKELMAYHTALEDLQKKKISLSIGNTRKRYKLNNTRISSIRLFNISNYSFNSNGDFVFEYNFGKYGETLIKSKRYSNNVPIDMVKVSFQQIEIVYLFLYLSRLIFINKRKLHSEKEVMLETIFKQIKIHDKQGNNTQISLYGLINGNYPTKYVSIRQFQTHLLYVLEMFKKMGTIRDYRMYPIDIKDLSIKNYQSTKLQIIIK